MNLSLDAYMSKEPDGYDGSVRMSRDEVEDIYQLLDLFSEFTRALGYSYIKAVGFEKNDETVIWSDF